MAEFNLSKLSQDERNKINVDLAASGVACRERLKLPVSALDIEKNQPADLRDYFLKRLAFYREKSREFTD